MGAVQQGQGVSLGVRFCLCQQGSDMKQKCRCASLRAWPPTHRVVFQQGHEEGEDDAGGSHGCAPGDAFLKARQTHPQKQAKGADGEGLT